MSTRTATRLAWSLWTLLLLFLGAAIPLRLGGHRPFAVSDLSQMTSFVAIATVGAVVASHQPRNPLGWIYLGIGSIMVTGAGVLGDYAFFVRVAHPGLPGATAAEWITNWAWVPAFSTLLTFSLLLFPNGHPPSPRWRPVLWASGVLIPLWSIAFMFETADYSNALNHHAPNPYAIAGLSGFFNGAKDVISIVFFVLLACSVASLVVRFRHGDPDERHQLKWLIFGAVLVFAWFVLPFNHGNGGWVDAVSGLVIALIPISAGVAILKYRLYDIDVVISKAVVFGALAAFITVVYVAVVAGLGSLFSGGGLALRIAATAIVAVAFQSVRERANRVANRVVYGERATPYEVLARFSERVGSTYSDDDVLPRIARVVAEGSAAERAEVWLHIGSELRLAASWPAGAVREALPVTGDAMPDLASDRTAPVRHHGELLGAIAVIKPSSERLAPHEAELLDRLAEQSGLMLANVRLTADLEARLEQIALQAAQLRASRQRIVAAQDEERRRLERNIHDGAQQHLVALAVKLRLAKAALAKDPDRGAETLRGLGAEIEDALDTLRALSLGIYPPLLEEQGIASALAAQYLRSGLPVQVETQGITRHPIELEAAVYFCVLEALQNAAKYARATAITVRLLEQGAMIEFEVEDDGAGFDPSTDGNGTGLHGLADRLAVFGGDVTLRSAPGRGTLVRGRLPVPAMEVSA